MLRKIIKIDEDKCDGCGLCAEACHEAAIGMVDGKAKLLRDDYCDGLGDCLPACATGAITFEEREAAAYNEEEVQKNMQDRQNRNTQNVAPSLGGYGGVSSSAGGGGGCPGSMMRTIQRSEESFKKTDNISTGASANTNHKTVDSNSYSAVSELQQWPVQIKLVPVKAPYFEGANLLISADCAAYARANFHGEFMHVKTTVIGCPKLDDVDYSEKLGAIIAENNIKSVTIVRMEVPCCGGIEQAAIAALKNSGKMIPWRVVTLSIGGDVLEDM
jgi:NAD-dependent dihydropyrimidine dehydrogenase PreA subunit